MKKKIDYSDAAQDDLQESYDWYEKQRQGLGEEFLDEVEQHLIFIENTPQSFPIYQHNYRSCKLKRFPFKIIYSVEGTSLKVWAVYHHKRDPKKWKR